MKGILIDSQTGDIMVAHGQVQTGDTDMQTVELLLNTAPGEWKENPLLGADARSLLGGNTDPFWALNTKKMIRAAGVEINNIKATPEGITIS